jgi:hypothetical protein
VTVFKSFCSFPQGVISGGRGGKTVEERLDVVIFVVMKELFKLLSKCYGRGNNVRSRGLNAELLARKKLVCIPKVLRPANSIKVFRGLPWSRSKC